VRQLGVSKGTISKAIASGKLSATRREDGSWAIDGSELARYLEVNGHRFRSETVPSEQAETDAELRARADLAEQRLAELRSLDDDMQAQRDTWETVAQRLSLPAPKPVETSPNGFPCLLRNRLKRRKPRQKPTRFLGGDGCGRRDRREIFPVSITHTLAYRAGINCSRLGGSHET